jgi:polyketide biosynthesis acyl carrier protein
MSNDRERALVDIRHAIAEVLPDLEVDRVSIDDRLHDLGADSVQRAEVLILAMEELAVNIPMVHFAQSKNIGGIVDVFARAVEGV